MRPLLRRKVTPRRLCGDRKDISMYLMLRVAIWDNALGVSAIGFLRKPATQQLVFLKKDQPCDYAESLENRAESVAAAAEFGPKHVSG